MQGGHASSRRRDRHADFFDVDLHGEPDIPPVPALREWEECLRTHRFIVLGGADFEDKDYFAFYLAWRWREYLSNCGKHFRAKQWQPGLQPLSFDTDLHKLEDCTIILFPSVQPHEFRYDLLLLSNAISSAHRELYAIVTTDSRLSDWALPNATFEHSVWRDLRKDIYEVGFLANWLGTELKKCNMTPGERGLFPNGWNTIDDPVIGNIIIRDAVLQLKTPRRVRSFVHTLRSVTEAPTEQVVLDLLAELGGDVNAVMRWYRGLDPRHQKLALGLTLLSGTFHDQALAAMEVLAEQGWRQRDPTFSPPDCNDLPPLAAYFQGVAVGPGNPVVEVVSEPLKTALLNVGWELHRRLIMVTIPVLANLAAKAAEHPGQVPPTGAEESSAPHGDKNKEGETVREAEKASEPLLSPWLGSGPVRDLFGSPLHSSQMQRAISHTFSLLGLVSFEAIEPALLYLAAQPSLLAQAVAAAAIARWRSPENNRNGSKEGDDLYFATLERWQFKTRVIEAVRQIAELPPADAFPRIRATIAIAVAFGAQFDREKLSARLDSLVRNLQLDGDKRVRAAFQEFTLPHVVARHADGLQDFLLKETVLEPDLHRGLALGLAAGLEIKSEATRALIDRWYEGSREGQGGTHHQIPHKAETLAVVMLALGFAAWRKSGSPQLDSSGVLSDRDVFGRFEEVLRTDSRVAVRKSALEAVFLQAIWDFEGAEEGLRAALDEVLAEKGESSYAERDEAVKGLVDLYQSQRLELTGGDGVCFVKELPPFHVWRHESDRPLTQIERAFESWFSAAGAAGSFAMRVADQLGKTVVEIAERKFRQKSWRDISRAKQSTDRTDLGGNRGAASKLSWLDRLIPWIATAFPWRDRLRFRSQVADRFATLLEMAREEQCQPIEILDRIRVRIETASADGKQIVQYLQCVLRVHRNRIFIVTSLLLTLVALSIWILLAQGRA